jgi:metal-dependent amidase/aminoacylase/carboxypeptidase family protein
MLRWDDTPGSSPPSTERSYQGIRNPARSNGHGNDVAQRHQKRSRLSRVTETRQNLASTALAETGLEADVTTALTAPDGAQTEWPGPLPGAEPLPGQLDRWLASRGAELVAIRRHIHAHPELSYQEFETSALVARELAVAGLSPRILPAGNGVICDIGEGDRVIAFRADLDALPLHDTKDVPYRSTVEQAAHACGHDVHTTVLLGLGLALAQLAEQGELPGRVRLIFQPAEETVPSGAPVMITGSALKAADTVEVKLTGPGGHTARPHLTADLVHALGRVIVDVPSLLDRRIDPRAGVSMVWGAVHAGQAFNAIPGEGEARGTVRILNREAWRDAPALITKLIEEVVAPTGAQVEVSYQRGVPPVINDRMAAAVIAGAAGAALGADRVVEAEISMGGEDFAFYLDHVPGAMIRLGTGVAGATAGHDLHQGDFDVDERCIGYGVRVMVHTALAALSTGAF